MGGWRVIQWPNYVPTELGYFNLSYCDRESVLYFDCCYRYLLDSGGIIYSSKLDSTSEYGQAYWSEALPLPQPINIDGYISLMADITPSGDTLFFSSDRPGSRGGTDIWISTRIDGIWTEPVNLGDSVNGPLNEFAPNYASASGLLFFDIMALSGSDANLYSSRSMGNNLWSLAERLPDAINVPGNSTYGPSFDEALQVLYFTSFNEQHDINSISRSNYTGGQWGPVVMLGDSVNGFYYPNVCNRVTTENPDISGTILFYDKHVWEQTYCIDFSSFPLYSRSLPSAVGEREKIEEHPLIQVYPNPSNGLFTIRLMGENTPFLIDIYNISGQRIRTLGVMGRHEITWDGRNEKDGVVSSGVYFYRIRAGEYVSNKRCLLIK